MVYNFILGIQRFYHQVCEHFLKIRGQCRVLKMHICGFSHALKPKKIFKNKKLIFITVECNSRENKKNILLDFFP